MYPTREALLARAASLPARPVAVEASWDGDSSGWYVRLALIHPDPAASPGTAEFFLGDFQGPGGDMRIFNDQVPPWPEAVEATRLGREIADHFAIPFYFGSPDRPEDDCPRWWDRGRAYPCRRCGMPLLQREECPWRGACYHCHLDEEREAKVDRPPGS